MSSNAKRILDKVVSVDAWQSQFDENDKASIHVDLNFLEARFGENAASPVRFSVRIKRAELVFADSENEPFSVIQSSVARQKIARGIVTKETCRSAGLSGEASLRASTASPIPFSGAARATGEVSTERRQTAYLESETSENQVSQYRDEEGYCWEIKPSHNGSDHLIGKIWDPVLEPRLSIKRTSRTRIEPVCRVFLRCRREDIKIFNIEFKKSTSFADRYTINKQAAAAAFIRSELTNASLEYGDFEEILSEVILADLIVQHEVS